MGRIHDRINEMLQQALDRGDTPYSLSLSTDIAFDYTFWRAYPHRQAVPINVTHVSLVADRHLPPNSIVLRCRL